MVDKTTPRLGLPVPFLTNPLKIDVGKLTEALTMLDANAVMLTDWDITADGWQKMGTITDLAQGKIALTLMVITGTGFANIVMQTGDGSVTTVGDPARISVTAQTNLGANTPTILGGKVVETAEDSYEVWFNIAPSTAPRKWSALLAAGNGAKIDWTHAVGPQPANGVTILIARSLTDQEIASPTITRNGAVLTAGYAGLMGINHPYYDFAASGDKITDHIWRVGEVMRVKKEDATAANGWPPEIPVVGTGYRINCDGLNETRSMRYFTFTTEGVTPTTVYRIGRTNTNWTTPPTRLYSSEVPPTAAEVKAVPTLTEPVNTVINLNDRILPLYYGVMSITNVAGAVAANNYPYDELGQLFVFPFGKAGGVTQLYVTVSGRIAARNYDGAVFSAWRKGANSGANDDITSLTNLSGPLKLGGDAVNDYDAVTFKQLKAASGGSGPTMNGVVNNFVGAVEWWNGDRAKIPAGYIPADGQLLKRSDYPELWAAIQNSVLNNVSEDQWQASGITAAPFRNQGLYSTGTITSGADANFRMPDMNGATTGNFGGMFLSGPARGNQSGTLTTRLKGMYSQAAPNILGSLSNVFNQPNIVQSGALSYSAAYGNAVIGSGGNAIKFNNLLFDASTSNNTYGADVAWLYPNNIVGIWLIRVAGSFQAANTNFSVITGDATRPSNNTAVFGGSVISDYQVAGVSEAKTTLRAAGTIAGNYVSRISTYNKTKNVTKDFDFYDDGRLIIPGALIAGFGGDGSTNGNIQSINGSFYAGRVFTTTSPKNGDVFTGAGIWLDGNQNAVTSKRMQSGLYTEMVWGGITRTMISTTDQVGPVTKYWFFNSDGTLAGPNGQINPVGSDIKLKDDVVPAAEGALGRIMKIQPKEFSWKSDGRPDRGYIAQDLQKIDPLYVFESFGHRKGDEILNVSQTALLADLIASVQDLQAQITELKK